MAQANGTHLDEAALMARPTAEFGRLSSRANVIAVVGLVAAAGGYFAAGDAFWQSYLIGYIFWIGITLGSLGILMIQHLTGGAWTMPSRRPLEAATRTLPLMVLLFIPIWLKLDKLYIWARPEARRRPDHPDQGRVPESAVLHVARRALLRDLGGTHLHPEQVVDGTGRTAGRNCRARRIADRAWCRARAWCSSSRRSPS